MFDAFNECFLLEMQYQLSLAWYYETQLDAHPSREDWFNKPKYYTTAPYSFARDVQCGINKNWECFA